ncbi:MAG: PTS sugar transporter subunit IIA [Burkholderiales bacterium]
MIGILLVTHGELGEALINAAVHVIGKPIPQVRALSVAASDTPDMLLARAKALLAELQLGDGVLVLSDICGGTPCNVVTRLISPGNVEAISGVSLPMLVRALTYRDKSLAQVVDKALSGGAEGVLHLSGISSDATN